MKLCRVCDKRLPLPSFNYGNRTDRAYCHPCSLEVAQEYNLHGKGAAERVRTRKRAEKE